MFAGRIGIVPSTVESSIGPKISGRTRSEPEPGPNLVPRKQDFHANNGSFQIKAGKIGPAATELDPPRVNWK